MSAELSPYDVPDLYDLIFESFDFDVPFWRRVAREANGPILDVGCGSGRVMLRLVGEGHDVDGLDSSEAMISKLREKAAARGLEVRAMVADMRDFTMPRRYARAICAFNAFAHMETTEDQIRALRCCREHLLPEGVLVLHLSYPGPRYWSEPDGAPVLELERRDEETGDTLQLWDTRSKQPVEQRQRSVVEVRRIDAGGAVIASHRSTTTQRWVYRYELELLLRAAGFARWEIRGGFDDEPLEREDQQMLAWAWRET